MSNKKKEKEKEKSFSFPSPIIRDDRTDDVTIHHGATQKVPEKKLENFWFHSRPGKR